MDSAAKDFGDDMVIEILELMPPESIFRFQSVSKQWNSLLTSPEFLSRYSRRFHHRRQRTQPPHNLLGFFLPKGSSMTAPRVPFFSTHPEISRESFSSDLGSFTASSNGLILCVRDLHPRPYHILNPVTRKHVSLPPPRQYYNRMLSIGLSCDEDGDDLTPRYEVVIAYDGRNSDLDSKKLFIETYSSETEEWRESVLVATSNFSLLIFDSLQTVVVNGVFYWTVGYNLLAVYDPHKKLGGDKDGNHLQLIQLPGFGQHVLSQTPDGRLIFGRTYNALIKIWELSAWKLGFRRETTIITKQEWDLIYEIPCAGGLDQVVALIPCDPLILLVRMCRNVSQYNTETKEMKHIVDLPEERQRVNYQPFFEAVSFSAYLLA